MDLTAGGSYTSTWLETAGLVHDLACHPTDDSKLLAIFSTPGAEAGAEADANTASFSLYAVFCINITIAN